jgi:hypothetical protein
VADLKPAARATVVAWVGLTVPLLAGAVVLFVVRLPHLAAAVAESIATHAGVASRSGDVATAVDKPDRSGPATRQCGCRTSGAVVTS